MNDSIDASTAFLASRPKSVGGGNVVPDTIKVRVIDVVYAAIRASGLSISKASERWLEEVAVSYLGVDLEGGHLIGSCL